MIKKVVMFGENMSHWGCSDKSSVTGEIHHVKVRFTDGTLVNLNEEELKNAALLAEKGCLHA